MLDKHVKITRQSWLSRLKESIKGVLCGVVLFAMAFPLFFWNEARSRRAYLSMKEGAGAVVSLPSDQPNPANNGKLIHLTGEATTEELLKDPVFGVSAAAITLMRKVEMYQWREEEETKEVEKLGGTVEKVTTYTYSKTWSENLINSSKFHMPQGHENPSSMPYESYSWTARNVKVGGFVLTPSLIGKIGGAVALPLSDADLAALSPELRSKTKLHGGGFYIGRDPLQPAIGDIRITFSVVKPQTVSIVAQQRGNSFQPYQTKAGDTIELLSIGAHGAQEMFQKAQRQNVLITWLLRLAGFLMMFSGLSLVFRPISTLGSVIPLVGNLLGAGIGLFAFLVSLALSLLTVAIAWVAVRPLLAVPLLLLMVGSIMALFYFSMRKRKRTAAMVGGGEV